MSSSTYCLEPKKREVYVSLKKRGSRELSAEKEKQWENMTHEEKQDWLFKQQKSHQPASRKSLILRIIVFRIWSFAGLFSLNSV